MEEMIYRFSKGWQIKPSQCDHETQASTRLVYKAEVRDKLYHYGLVPILTKGYSLVMGLSGSGWWLNIVVLKVFNLDDLKILCIIYIPVNW